MRRLSCNGEEGGVAVFVTILLVVIFGMGALVVDVGQLYWERRQLQTGAEAGALALAADCAEGIVDCATATLPILGNAAQPYADLNSQDSRSEVPPAMNHGTEPTLCEPGSGTANNPLTDGGKYVKVSTETIDASNEESFITHFLAPVLGFDTGTVTACAVASWGPVGGPLNVLPLAICDSDFNALTAGGFGPPAEKIWYGKDECPFGTEAYPGGYGWLTLDDATVEPATGTCSLAVPDDQWLPGRTGDSANTATYGDCIAALKTHIVSNGGEALVYVPIFDDYCSPNVAPHCGPGEHKLHVDGFGAFMISGYRFVGGGGVNYMHPNASICNGGGPGNTQCVYGYFTEFVTYDGFIDAGAGDYGGTTVNLTN